MNIPHPSWEVRPRLIVYPDSTLRMSWDLASVLCVGVVAVIVPLEIGFDQENVPPRGEMGKVTRVMMTQIHFFIFLNLAIVRA